MDRLPLHRRAGLTFGVVQTTPRWLTDTADVSVRDTAVVERLLLYIYSETNALRNELQELTGELLAEELDRFEATLASIQSALLFAMPDPAVTH
jgi:hypothetical protein